MLSLIFKKKRGLQAEHVWFKIFCNNNHSNLMQMKKTSSLLTRFATLLFICMGALLLYVWINYDELRSEQSHRQTWYFNHKYENK